MYKIDSTKLLRAYLYGDTIEMTTANGTTGADYQGNIWKTLCKSGDGRIHDMDTSSSTRLDNLKSTKQTMKKLRRLVAHNFTGGINQLWITLTYRDHVTDPAIVYMDFKAFIRRIRNQFGNVDYLPRHPRCGCRSNHPSFAKFTTQ